MAPGARCMIAAKALIGMSARAGADGAGHVGVGGVGLPGGDGHVGTDGVRAARDELGLDAFLLEIAVMDGGEMPAELDRLDPAELVDDAIEALGAQRACGADGHVAEPGKRARASHEAAAVEMEGRGGRSTER